MEKNLKNISEEELKEVNGGVSSASAGMGTIQSKAVTSKAISSKTGLGNASAGAGSAIKAKAGAGAGANKAKKGKLVRKNEVVQIAQK